MASFPTANNIINLLADVDLSSSQYTAVSVTATGTIEVASINDTAIGFLMNNPTAGQICEIATYGGGAKGISAATLAAGVLVKTDANGHLVLASAAPDIAVAITLVASVDNDVIEVMPILNHI